jgi:hypothetical protein
VLHRCITKYGEYLRQVGTVVSFADLHIATAIASASAIATATATATSSYSLVPKTDRSVLSKYIVYMPAASRTLPKVGFIPRSTQSRHY